MAHDSNPTIVPASKDSSSATYQAKKVPWEFVEDILSDILDEDLYAVKKAKRGYRLLEFKTQRPTNGTIEFSYDESTGVSTLTSSTSSDAAIEEMIRLLAEMKKQRGSQSNVITFTSADERAQQRAQTACEKHGLVMQLKPNEALSQKGAKKTPDSARLDDNNLSDDNQLAQGLAQRRRAHVPPSSSPFGKH
jgi:hypothetical protein